MIDIIGLVSGSLSGPLADVIWTSPLTVGTRALITQDACTWDNEDSMAKNVWMGGGGGGGGARRWRRGGQTLQWLRTQKLRISLYEYIGGGGGGGANPAVTTDAEVTDFPLWIYRGRGANPAVTTDAEVTDFPLWIYSFQRFSLFILEKIRIRPCILHLLPAIEPF